MSAIRLSVVIRTYRRDIGPARTIEAIRRQDLSGIEIVISTLHMLWNALAARKKAIQLAGARYSGVLTVDHLTPCTELAINLRVKKQEA